VKVPCELREAPEICAGENVTDFSEDSQKSSGKSRKWWKNFYGQGTLFIGVGGGLVPRTCLDSTVVRFPEDACPLRRFEGDVFYQSSKVFMETDRRSQPSSPRGKCWGLGKTLSPSKCRITEIHETGTRNNYRKKGLYLWKNGWNKES
jgi:hypothetical protein